MASEKEPVDRPNIEYPCNWEYKIIGQNTESLQEAVRASFEAVVNTQDGSRSCEISGSRTSAGKKYASISLVMVVETEEERDALYAALKSIPGVKMVI